MESFAAEKEIPYEKMKEKKKNEIWNRHNLHRPASAHILHPAILRCGRWRCVVWYANNNNLRT